MEKIINFLKQFLFGNPFVELNRQQVAVHYQPYNEGVLKREIKEPIKKKPTAKKSAKGRKPAKKK